MNSVLRLASNCDGARAMVLVELVLVGLATAGHFIVWVTVVNRVHALAIPLWAINGLSACCFAFLVVIPGMVLLAHEGSIDWTLLTGNRTNNIRYAQIYMVPCAAVALAALLSRIVEQRQHKRSRALLANHTTSVNMIDRLGHRPVAGRITRLATRLPGNQVLQPRLQEKSLLIRRLDPALNGLKLVHLSDLHMSGRIGISYFQEVVDLTNSLEPDLVAMTGDLFDSPSCLDWIDDTLGRLKSRFGVYFVLGNHDLRVDWQFARQQLTELGLVNLGSCWREIDIHGSPVILAGNELPWFVPAADMEHCPQLSACQQPLRLLLSHSPDQIDWAQRYDFDLMLAGHTHGGQIRLPLLGSVVSPSRLGNKYSGGVYDLPPTVLHVSRGISSLTPLRWNCPPELAVLELCR